MTDESFFDRLERDRLAQQADLEKTTVIQENETKRAKMEARRVTKEILGYVAGGLTAAAVLITLALVFWTDFGEDPEQQPEVSDAQIEQQREERCIDTGGGWLPKDTFQGSYPDSGMCFYPGDKVEVAEQ